MPDENQPGEMPTQQPGETPNDGKPQTLEDALAAIERMQAALTKANNEAKKYRQRAKAAKQEPAQELPKPGEMSEADKLKQEKQEALERAQKAEDQSRKRLIKAAFIAEASRLQVKNPQDAYALALAEGKLDDIEIDDDDNVEGVPDLVKSYVEAGRLPTNGRQTAPTLDGGAGGGNPPTRTIHLTPEQKQLAAMAKMTEQQYIDYLVKGEQQAQARTAPDLGGLKPPSQ